MHRTISTLWLRVRTWTIEVSIAVVNMVNMLPVSCQPLALQSHASARGAAFYSSYSQNWFGNKYVLRYLHL